MKINTNNILINNNHNNEENNNTASPENKLDYRKLIKEDKTTTAPLSITNRITSTPNSKPEIDKISKVALPFLSIDEEGEEEFDLDSSSQILEELQIDMIDQSYPEIARLFAETDLVISDRKSLSGNLNVISTKEYEKICKLLDNIFKGKNCIQIRGDLNSESLLKNELVKLASRRIGRNLLSELSKIDNFIAIKSDSKTTFEPAKLKSSNKPAAIISIDFDEKTLRNILGHHNGNKKLEEERYPFISLAHELIHAYHYFTDSVPNYADKLSSEVDPLLDNLEEERTILGEKYFDRSNSTHISSETTDDEAWEDNPPSIYKELEISEYSENAFRAAFGLPIRTSHHGIQSEFLKGGPSDVIDGNSLLSIAVANGLNTNIAHWIDPSLKDNPIEFNKKAILEKAKESSIDWGAVNSSGQTTLHKAAVSYGYARQPDRPSKTSQTAAKEIFSWMTASQKYPLKDFVKHQDSNGDSVFHCLPPLWMAKELLIHNNKNNQVLSAADINNAQRLVKNSQEALLLKNKSGLSPLACICKESIDSKEIVELAELFIDSGAPLTDRDIKKSPLYLAVTSNNQPLIKLLLDKGADLTPLLKMQDKELFHKLLENVPDLRDNKEYQLAAVRKNSWNLKYADKLRGDKEVVLTAINKNWKTLSLASDALKDDKEVILTAIQRNGRSLRFASDRLKDDKETVLMAIKNDKSAIKFASDRLKQDPEILEYQEFTTSLQGLLPQWLSSLFKSK